MRVVDHEIWSAEFVQIAERAVLRSIEGWASGSPSLAAHVSTWIARFSDLVEPARYFTQAHSLPVLAFPWWLEKRIRGRADVEFQADLMFSTVSGYYFTRMIDDIMDDHEVPPAAVPALYPFHKQLMEPYCKYFPPFHPFWLEFDRLLMRTVEAASVEVSLQQIDEAAFVAVSARKPTAALIPVAAVCFRYERADLLQLWSDFFALYGRWHQMNDDLVDWSSDHQSGNHSWLLCEAERRRAHDEPVSLWMGREGYEWTRGLMDSWMDDAIAAAQALGAPELTLYLEMRKRAFSCYINRMTRTAAAYARLLQVDAASSKHTARD
jgi:hypothetical protein